MAALEKTPLVEVWRRIIVGLDKTWALFEHGTCVIFVGGPSDIAGAAVTLLREWRPVHAGSPAGDFSVVNLEDHPGWVVTCHHPDVLTYVPPAELEPNASELSIGLFGRTQRDLDAAQLNVVYIEEKNPVDPVCFYSKTVESSELSNFSPFGFEDEGLHWQTVEHYFQAQKFSGPSNAAYREKIGFPA